MRKGQAISLDAMIGIGIFILIIISAGFIWNYSRERISSAERRNDIEVVARNALAGLVSTSGNKTSLGLASEYLELDYDEYNYSTTKKLLGVQGYEYRLDFKTWNGTNYALNYSIGIVPNASASEVVQVERYVLLDNIRTQIRFRLWKSCVVC